MMLLLPAGLDVCFLFVFMPPVVFLVIISMKAYDVGEFMTMGKVGRSDIYCPVAEANLELNTLRPPESVIAVSLRFRALPVVTTCLIMWKKVNTSRK